MYIFFFVKFTYNKYIRPCYLSHIVSTFFTSDLPVGSFKLYRDIPISLQNLPINDIAFRSNMSLFIWVLQNIVAHLSMRSARNTMGTREPRSDTRDLRRRW